MVSPGRPKGTAGGPGVPRGVAARGALALIAAGALIGLIACGGTVAGGSAHPASAGTGGSTGPAPAVTAPAGNQGFRPVAVQLTGCRSVTGLGPARSWSQSPQFGPLLTRTVGGAGRLIPGRHPSSVPTP
jgi:hypothetical protein